MVPRVAGTQHDVFARVVWAIIDVAATGGLPRAPLFEGVPFDASSVRGLERVSWNDYVTVCENIGRLAGDGLEDLFESCHHLVFPELRVAFGTLVDSKQLARFLITIVSPIAFAPVEHRFEDFGDRHIRVTGRLRPGARPSRTWFRGAIGAIRGFTGVLDQPPAQVRAEIGPDFGIYDVILPPRRTVLDRVRSSVDAAVRIVLGRDSGGELVTVSLGHVDPFEAQLRAAEQRWQLTPLQLDVLRRLAHGDCVPEIARARGCDESEIARVLEQLRWKMCAASETELVARLWSES